MEATQNICCAKVKGAVDLCSDYKNLNDQVAQLAWLQNSLTASLQRGKTPLNECSG